MATPAAGPMFLDWSIVEAGGSQGVVDLADVDLLRVDISQAPMPYLDPGGSEIHAWNVTFSVQSESGALLAGIRERLDASTGRAASIGWPSYRTLDETGVGAARLGTANLPVMLFGSWLWGRTYQATEEFTVAWNSTMHSAGHSPVEQSTDVRVTVNEGPDGCQAHVLVEGPNPFLPTSVKTFELTYNGAPFPTTYEASMQGATELRMQLKAYGAGSGEPLPQTPHAPSTPWRPLPRAQLVGGVPAEQDSAYPTASQTAIQVAREHAATKEWLNGHPNARISELDHVLGAHQSNVLDQWTITWAASNGDGLETVVRQHRDAGLPLIGPGQWGIETSSAAAPYPGISRAVTLNTMAKIHEQIYGSPPEVLDCFLHKNQCWVGTHAHRGAPYAGGDEAVGFVLPGLLFDIHEGLLLQADAIRNPLA